MAPTMFSLGNQNTGTEITTHVIIKFLIVDCVALFPDCFQFFFRVGKSVMVFAVCRSSPVGSGYLPKASITFPSAVQLQGRQLPHPPHIHRNVEGDSIDRHI